MLQTVLALPFPAIDPVALRIGPVFGWGPVLLKWYGLAYMGGLLLGWLYLRRLLDQTGLWPNAKAPFTNEATEDLLLMMTFGIIIGGRLGHVLFYHPAEYLGQPLEILKVWNGGMAFHGGLLGAGVAAWLFARRNQTSWLSVFDACSAVVPFGLFFGRVANFINGEYWGNITTAPWGMVFPNPAAGLFPRHPSQLYEALLEGLLLFFVLRTLTHQRMGLKSPGQVTGVFLIGYGLARIFCEVFREPEDGAPFNFGPVTTGMVYCLPMIALGWWFVRRSQQTVASSRAQT
jgi:phosphatidylglycerol---prolipoprotein diacylglyceryl transferase